MRERVLEIIIRGQIGSGKTTTSAHVSKWLHDKGWEVRETDDNGLHECFYRQFSNRRQGVAFVRTEEALIQETAARNDLVAEIEHLREALLLIKKHVTVCDKPSGPAILGTIHSALSDASAPKRDLTVSLGELRKIIRGEE